MWHAINGRRRSDVPRATVYAGAPALHDVLRALVPSATANTVQNSNICVWLCPWALSCLLQQRQHHISGRANLRSAERHSIIVLSTRTQLGRRSFNVGVPAVWNALPPHLRSLSISRGQSWVKNLSLHTGLRAPLRTCWRAYCLTFTLLSSSMSAPDKSTHRTHSALPTLAAMCSAVCPTSTRNNTA